MPGISICGGIEWISQIRDLNGSEFVARTEVIGIVEAMVCSWMRHPVEDSEE